MNDYSKILIYSAFFPIWPHFNEKYKIKVLEENQLLIWMESILIILNPKKNISTKILNHILSYSIIIIMELRPSLEKFYFYENYFKSEIDQFYYINAKKNIFYKNFFYSNFSFYKYNLGPKELSKSIFFKSDTNIIKKSDEKNYKWGNWHSLEIPYEKIDKESLIIPIKVKNIPIIYNLIEPSTKFVPKNLKTFLILWIKQKILCFFIN